MNHSPLNHEQIVNLVREVESRVSQGNLLNSVLKELSIPRSTYRRWWSKYGDRAQGNGAAVLTIHGPEQSAGRPAQTEDAPELSKDLLAAANDASGPARNAWLAFLGLLAYLLVTL